MVNNLPQAIYDNFWYVNNVNIIDLFILNNYMFGLTILQVICLRKMWKSQMFVIYGLNKRYFRTLKNKKKKTSIAFFEKYFIY